MKIGVERPEDYVVQELGEQIASCYNKKSKGICSPCDCETCIKHEYNERFISQLTDYDQYRVYNYAEKLIEQQPKKIEYVKPAYTHTPVNRRRYKILIFIFCALFFLPLLCMCSSNNNIVRTDEYKAWYYSYSRRIEEVCKYTKANIKDYNRDGDTNCQDYVLIFYYRWKRLYDEHIEVVYNYNCGGAPHVFVRIRADDTFYPKYIWFYVEPQAPGGKWRIEEAWEDGYDYRLNEYDHDKWLKRIDR